MTRQHCTSTASELESSESDDECVFWVDPVSQTADRVAETPDVESEAKSDDHECDCRDELCAETPDVESETLISADQNTETLDKTLTVDEIELQSRDAQSCSSDGPRESELGETEMSQPTEGEDGLRRSTRDRKPPNRYGFAQQQLMPHSSKFDLVRLFSEWVNNQLSTSVSKMSESGEEKGDVFVL